MIKGAFKKPIFYKSINITFESINTDTLSKIIYYFLEGFDRTRFICVTSDNAPVMKSLASTLYDKNRINLHQFGNVCHTFTFVIVEIFSTSFEIKEIHKQI